MGTTQARSQGCPRGHERSPQCEERVRERLIADRMNPIRVAGPGASECDELLDRGARRGIAKNHDRHNQPPDSGLEASRRRCHRGARSCNTFSGPPGLQRGPLASALAENVPIRNRRPGASCINYVSPSWRRTTRHSNSRPSDPRNRMKKADRTEFVVAEDMRSDPS